MSTLTFKESLSVPFCQTTNVYAWNMCKHVIRLHQPFSLKS